MATKAKENKSVKPKEDKSDKPEKTTEEPKTDDSVETDEKKSAEEQKNKNPFGRFIDLNDTEKEFGEENGLDALSKIGIEFGYGVANKKSVFAIPLDEEFDAKLINFIAVLKKQYAPKED